MGQKDVLCVRNGGQLMCYNVEIKRNKEAAGGSGYETSVYAHVSATCFA